MPSIRQSRFILYFSLYIGGLLNLTTLIHKLHFSDLSANAVATLGFIAAIGFTYVLLSILSLAGYWPFKVLTALIVLFSAAASYYMSAFNVVIGYGMVISVLTTDIDLSRESLGYKFIFWWLLAGLLPALWILSAKILPPALKLKANLIKKAAITTAVLIVTSICLKGAKFIGTRQAELDNTYTASISGIIAHSYLPSNWLAALGLHAVQMVMESREQNTLFDPAKHFTYTPQVDMSDLYVVYIIGETTRYDHMSILGYPRETTPLMEKEPNLVALPGHSCDTATKLSLRCMFVRQGGTKNNPQRTLKERNVFAVLKDLGFSSELFAMQSEVWFYSSINADRFEIREIIASGNQDPEVPLDDMLLINKLHKSLAQHPEGKHLMVLHTKGSHYLYTERYPESFARFKPECDSIDDSCSKTQLINSFDNSVAYVDLFIKRVIDQVRDKNAIVFYASDHGESISNDTHFHATPRSMAPPEQFRVPIITWASDKFLAHPVLAKRFNNLRNMRDKHTWAQQEQIFDSLLDCIGYNSPNGGIDKTNSWCSEQAKH